MKQIEIQANGFTFSALTDGADDAPLLLLLHGLSRTSWEWHHQIPALADIGFRTVAIDMRGRCPGARPAEIEAYAVGEFVADVLAIADRLAGEESRFHLMGTSIGAMIAWHVAAANPARVKTLACINIAHPAAFIEVATATGGEAQREKMSYVENSRIEGNERATFESTLERMGLPASETDPYRVAFSSDEALRAVYHWYRAARFDPAHNTAIPSVTMPTMFLWPPGAGNVTRDTAEATANYVTGPYRFEILENARNFALQAEPERVTRLLVEHLTQYGQHVEDA